MNHIYHRHFNVISVAPQGAHDYFEVGSILYQRSHFDNRLSLACRLHHDQINTTSTSSNIITNSYSKQIVMIINYIAVLNFINEKKNNKHQIISKVANRVNIIKMLATMKNVHFLSNDGTA